MTRIKGISDVTIFGQRDYAMRIWVDPDRLAARNLTSIDVVQAIQAQNNQVAAGQIGQAARSGRPAVPDHALDHWPAENRGRVRERDCEGDRDGKIVRVKDVARVELGAKNQDVSNRFDRKPTVGLAVFILFGRECLGGLRCCEGPNRGAEPGLP